VKTLRGKKALITGAGSGIGRAIALELARHGTDLHLLDLAADPLEAVCREVRDAGAEAVPIVCDLSEPDQVSRAVAGLLERWGGLDILVNNAAVLCAGPVQLVTAEQWRRTLAVNLHAPIQLITELLDVLLGRPEAHILNVCSMTGLFALRKLAPYQTSKFALVGLTESLRADLRKTRVGATALCPGFTRTALIDSADNAEPARPFTGPPRWLCTTPHRVARHAVRAIRRNRPLVLVTPLAKLLFLAKRISPRAFDLLRKYA